MNYLLKAFKEVDKSTLNKGLNWYNNANRYAEYLSNTYKIDFDKVCAIISALSPACSWEVNKRDAEKMVLCYVWDLDYSYFNFSTYGTNVVKAWNILKYKGSERIEDKFFSLKTGAKTYNFYLNIKNPLSKEYITIDRHAIAIFEGRKSSGSRKITPKQYKAIAEKYITTAKRLKLLPCQFQAILWEHHVNN
jgi:hypothetical protein